jgi:hypothetical protein
MHTDDADQPPKESPPDLSTSVRKPVTRWLVGLGATSFVAHILVAGNYGYFRDELYYIADGHHLQAGYVDQPLLMGWLAALLRVTIGDSMETWPNGPGKGRAGAPGTQRSLAGLISWDKQAP